MRRASILVLLLTLLAITLGQTPVARAESRNPHTALPVYFVMDISGSMEGDRLSAAKGAVRAFLAGLQPDQTMALYTFPGGRKRVDNCAPGGFSIRPERVNAANAEHVVHLLASGGNTPTVPALKEVMRNVVDQGFERAQVVLFTDGEANCGDSNDVCSVVPLLKQQGIELTVHTVSLNNTPSGDASLACLAKATGGTFAPVTDTNQLVDAVRRASSYAAALAVRLPATMPRVTGRARELAPAMEITVTSEGTALIPDAQLLVTFSAGSPERRVEVEPWGAVPVGNVDVGETIRRTLTLYPMATSDGPVNWKVSLVTGGMSVASSTGTVRVTAGASIDTAGVLLKNSKSVVILGDSFSSGEGAGSYEGGRMPRDANCHRSSKAYGRVLFPDAGMIACSGALTSDMNNANDGSGEGGAVEPQLYELLKLTATDNPPDLVLMTLGGNDSGFANVISGFIWTPTGKDVLEIRPAMEWATLTSRLASSYGHVNAVVNAPEAIAQRNGKVAQIVVLPYVRPVPAAGGDGCFVLVSSHELALANGFATSLNEAVRSAVERAAADGAPIHLAAPVEYTVQPHHTICDAETWIKTVHGDSVIAAFPQHLRQELMHPNAEGNAAIAASLVEWSRTVSPKPLTKVPPDYRDIPVVRSVWALAKSRTLGGQGIELPLPDIVLEPGQDVSVQLCIEGCEFDSAYVLVSSFSEPIPLGTLPVSPETRRAVGQIRLPAELEPGTHTIVLRGFDAAGSIHEARFTVQVWRQGTNLGIYFIGFGALLTLVGLVLRWAGGKGRVTSSQVTPGDRMARTSP